MKGIIIAAMFLAVIGSMFAQGGKSVLFDNTKYRMKDGHVVMLREDGKLDYDGRFLFERCARNMETDKYIPFVITIVNEKGEKQQVHAALEIHEAPVNNKIWFTIYEGPLGGMRQSWFTVAAEAQARI